MIEKIKALFQNTTKIDYYVRRFALYSVFVGVMYLIFFQHSTTETVFVEPDENYQRVIILDHIINEVDKKDTIIQIMYEEIPDYRNASADSLKREVARRYRGR